MRDDVDILLILWSKYINFSYMLELLLYMNLLLILYFDVLRVFIYYKVIVYKFGNKINRIVFMKIEFFRKFTFFGL